MKPSLFNTAMVRAILGGCKSVTRRPVKPQHLRVLDSTYHREHPEVPDSVLLEKLCLPPYQPGDILYVRETWQFIPCIDCRLYEHGGCNDTPVTYEDRDSVGEGCFAYREDCPEPERVCWHPSIHMPKEAARLFLRVVEVYPQKLMDAGEADARAEGFTSRAEFVAALLKMYPDCTEESWFWVHGFQRISKEEACRDE